VAEELTAKDVIRAHARDELGIDIDELANGWQVGCSGVVSDHAPIHQRMLSSASNAIGSPSLTHWLISAALPFILQAAGVSAIAFTMGAAIPLLSGSFINDYL
jgi:hypothetical protein